MGTLQEIEDAIRKLPAAARAALRAWFAEFDAPPDVAGLERAAPVAEGPAEALPLRAERPPLRVDEGGLSALARAASASI